MNRPPQIPRAVLAAGIILTLQISCAPYRVEYMEESLRRTTQPELAHKFGYPQRLKRLKNGDTMWEYDFQGRESQCVSYAITFDQEEQVRHWERRDCGPVPGGLKTAK